MDKTDLFDENMTPNHSNNNDKMWDEGENVNDDVIENVEDIDKYDKLIDEVFLDAQTLIKQLRSLKNKIPKLKAMYKKLKNKDIKKKPKKMSGFYDESLVPKSIAQLLGYKNNARKNRVKVVSDITKLIKARKLYYENNKQVYRADQQIIQALNLHSTVNDQTDPRHPHSLSIYTIHKVIAACYADGK